MNDWRGRAFLVNFKDHSMLRCMSCIGCHFSRLRCGEIIGLPEVEMHPSVIQQQCFLRNSQSKRDIHVQNWFVESEFVYFNTRNELLNKLIQQVIP